MNRSYDFSFIIPVFNEANRVVPNLRKVVNFVSQQSHSIEILVVCDGCEDQTPVLAETTLRKTSSDYNVISYRTNRGKGHAVKVGMTSSKGHYRVFFDIDLPTPLKTLRNNRCLLENDHPIIIGSRRMPRSTITDRQPWYRRWMGSVFTELANRTLGTEITDFTCGFKIFRHDVAKEIFSRMTLDGYAFDAEILYLAEKLNYSVREVPVEWSHDRRTKVNSLAEAYRGFRDLLAIRLNDASNRYKTRHRGSSQPSNQ